MKAVRCDRHGPGDVSEDDFDEGDSEVEDEDAIEDADDLRVTVSDQVKGQKSKVKSNHRPDFPFAFCLLTYGQKMCAVGIGHHRTCTFPMMYFFGTKPQCRLSELLFRWSPITK
jgi:hypothetical protein